MSDLSLRPRWWVGTIYCLGVGLAGWSLLLFGTLAPGSFDALSPTVLALHAALFLFFGLCSELTGVRLSGRVHLSIDMPFYIAGALVMGVVPAAWVMAAAHGILLALRSIRQWRERSEANPAHPPLYSIAYFVLISGLPGLLFLSLDLLMHVDARMGAARPDENLVLWLTPLLGISFLAAHYTLVGVALRLRGISSATIVRDMALPGFLAEGALTPLAVTLVVAAQADFGRAIPVNVIVLGAVFVLINGAFRKLFRIQGQMSSRVRELEALLNVGRAISASIDVEELCSKVQRETCSVIPGTDIFAIALRAAGSAGYTFRVYDLEQGRSAEDPRRQLLDVDMLTGPHGWVVAHRSPMRLEDVAAEVATFGPAQPLGSVPTRSWLGVPLTLSDEVVGVVSVQSSLPGAFNDDHLRVLDAVARQAAVAVENARLFQLATEDGLTGLYVRRYFERRLEEEWRRYERQKTPFGLVTVDLDGLKLVNDRMGHPAGDRLLAALGRVLRSAVRDLDIPARIGGDEMAVLLSGAVVEEASAIANRLREHIAATRVTVDGRTVQVTASVGVAHHPATGAESPAQLLELADRAMYRAKMAGGDRVEAVDLSKDHSRPERGKTR